MTKKSMTKKEPEKKESREELGESKALRIFRRRVDVAMKQIPNLQQFRDSDKMVDEIFNIGRHIFETPLDQSSPDTMLRLGGKLCGIYGYVGQKSAYARAERDVYEQKCSEVEKDLQLSYLAEDAKYKVTEVRARVSADVEELRELVILKEAEKNQWENVTEACDKMISFLQSGIKVKENERFNSGRLSGQA